jgi:hypothetical protein
MRQSKQPTPPPKFSVGDKVVYRADVWTVSNINKKYSPDLTTYEYSLTPVTRERIGSANTREIADEKYLQMYVPSTEHFDDVENKWVDEPNPFEGRTVVNEKGAIQSFVAARFDCIDPVVLKLLAECLGYGANKYFPYSYLRIPVEDHINHALNHINEHRRLSQDKTQKPEDELHLVNALARITFAISCLAKQGSYPNTYSHPEDNHAP